MKIMYFADAEDIHTSRWITYFANRGHEIHLLSFRNRNNFNKYQNIKFHSLKRNSTKERSLEKLGLFFTNKMNLGSVFFNPVSTLYESKKLIKTIDPDIIHGHSIVHHTMLAALTNFHPFVASAWGSDILIYPHKSKIVKSAVKFTLKRADLITADGVNTCEEIEKMGIERCKLYLISHGVDTNVFSHSCRNSELRDKLKIFDSPIVISTRRMSSVHDVETLIKAIPLVLNKTPNVIFLIIGSGGQKSDLVNLAKSLGIENNVRFIGSVPHSELAAYLSSSQIYISTSLSDGGVAVSTLEAMACELAPIVTNVGDNNKLIKNGENGFLFEVKNSEELANKIIYLLKNETTRIKFGKINREIIEKNANYYKEMEKMEKYYIDLIQRCKK